MTAASLVAAGAGLSGCVYDVGWGATPATAITAMNMAATPQGGYDAYYCCDYGHAFSHIALGGGWFGNYYYLGHGMLPFDNAGRRYPMRERHRGYWGERRHNW